MSGAGRTVAFPGTLGGPGSGIPVVGTSYDIGIDLADNSATTRLIVDAVNEIRSSYDVLADSRKGNPDNVVMVGGHLDSVPESPGVQDNVVMVGGLTRVRARSRCAGPGRRGVHRRTAPG
jgi:Zn-dependent M28 family amino/carboxypeptidase